MKQSQNNETRIKVQYAAKLLCIAMKTLKLSTPEMLCDIFDIFDISSKYRIDIVDYIDLMQRRENALNNLFLCMTFPAQTERQYIISLKKSHYLSIFTKSRLIW